LPLQIEWLQEQSMSGVFCMVSQTALQYLPEVIVHEHTGCAHFADLAFSIVLLLWRNVATFTVRPDLASGRGLKD
jgi:hypothetical protein